MALESRPHNPFWGVFSEQKACPKAASCQSAVKKPSDWLRLTNKTVCSCISGNMKTSKENNSMTKRLLFEAIALLMIAAFMASCSGSPVSDLIINDVEIGAGDEAVSGAALTMHYTGWLYSSGHRGNEFDSSLGRSPFDFTLGAGEVIEGWDRGIEGMRVGGKRELIIPPEMGYGASGWPPDIPPNSALIFEVELIAVRKSSD
jgi:FKBP-type peptidyl-prolyl cis-trans isomerase FkpA